MLYNANYNGNDGMTFLICLILNQKQRLFQFTISREYCTRWLLS